MQFKIIKIIGIIAYVLILISIYSYYYTYYPLQWKIFLKPWIFLLDKGFKDSLLWIGFTTLFFLVFILSSLSLGNAFMKWTGFKEENRPEHFTYSIAVGLLIMGNMVLGLALTGCLFVELLVIILLLSLPFYIYPYQEYIKKIKWSIKNISFLWEYIPLLFLLLLSFCIAQTPVIESDALRYHVALPELMSQQHGLFFYPYNTFFQFPALIEMQFLLGQMGNFVKEVHWLYYLLSILLIGRISKRYFPQVNPVWSQTIFASIPFIPIISGWPFVEMALTFYSLLLMDILLKIFNDQENQRVHYILCGFIGGGLLAMKYSMVTFVPFLLLGAAVLAWKSRKMVIQKISIMAISCILIASPWYIRNFINTGNPVYPLGYSIFGGDYWSQVNADFYMHHAQTKGGLNEIKNAGILEQAADIIWMPVKISLNLPQYAISKARNNARFYEWTGWRFTLPDSFGDWQISPIFLVLLPIFGFLLIRKRIPWREWSGYPQFWLGMMIMVYYLTWTQGYRDNRFLLPILPVLALFVGWIVQEAKSIFIKILIIGLVAYNMLWLTQIVLWQHNPFPYISGRVDDREYLSQNLNYYHAFEKWNLKAGIGNQTVLAIGEYRPMYLHRYYYCADYFDTPVILRVMKDCTSLEEIKSRLRELKVDDILYNPNELSLYLLDYTRHFRLDENSFSTPPVDIELYRQFINELVQKSFWKMPVQRNISDQELNQYRLFLNQPDSDPRFIYLTSVSL